MITKITVVDPETWDTRQMRDLPGDAFLALVYLLRDDRAETLSEIADKSRMGTRRAYEATRKLARVGLITLED